MLQKIICLLLIILVNKYSYSQKFYTDTLLSKCKQNIENACRNKITRDIVWKDRLVKADVAFIKKIYSSFQIGSFSKLKKEFKSNKFVTAARSFENVKDSIFIYEILFYTNYTKGSVLFTYRKDKTIVKKGCWIKTSYYTYCGANNGNNTVPANDLAFVERYILPSFTGCVVTDVCERVTIGDAEEIQALLLRE